MGNESPAPIFYEIHADRQDLRIRVPDTVDFLWLLLLSSVVRVLALTVGLLTLLVKKGQAHVTCAPIGTVGWSRISDDDGLYYWRRPAHPEISDAEMEVITTGQSTLPL